MKRTLTLVLAVTLLLSLAACVPEAKPLTWPPVNGNVSPVPDVSPPPEVTPLSPEVTPGQEQNTKNEDNKEADNIQIISVSAGEGHTMALDDEGNLWVWGDNYYGQIGDGNISTYHNPIYELLNEFDEYAEMVNGRVRNVDNDVYTPKCIMSNVKAIYAREGSSFAITNDEELYAWGYNADGQLGDGTNINKLTPTFIMDGVSDIDSGRGRTIIVKTDGSLWVVGRKFVLRWDDMLQSYERYHEPELLYTNVRKAVIDKAVRNGNGLLILSKDNTVISYLPKELNSSDFIFHEWKELHDVVDISSSFQNAYALTKNGDVYGWGPSQDLGIETDEFWIYTPVFITTNTKRILNTQMLIGNDDTLLIWGTVDEVEDYRNADGTDGGGGVIGDLIKYSSTPSGILSNMAMADGRNWHYIALDNDGNVYTWGDNFYGQLGDGSNITRILPQKISFS